MKIESIHNSHVKEWCKLKEKKYRDLEGLFLIEGEHLIQEAQKKGVVKEIIATDEQLKADFYVTEAIMKKISTQVSFCKRIAVCKKIEEQPIQNKLLLLDAIQDPGNLGTMIRSAVAFGFTDIIISMDTVDVYNEKTIRATEGMLFSMNIIRRDLTSFLESIKCEYTIYVTDVKKGESSKTIEKGKKMALLIGNEGNGVKEELKEYANKWIHIPMTSSCESLNASVAASILMYEMGDYDE